MPDPIAGTRRLWDRQPHETQRAYELFHTYLLMGHERSYAKLGRNLGRSRQTIEQTALRYDWQERLAAWQTEHTRKRSRDLQYVLETMAERHVGIALKAQEKLIDAIDALDFTQMTAGDVARWLEMVIKLERMALGEPDTILGGSVNHAVPPEPSKKMADRMAQLAADPARMNRIRDLMDEFWDGPTPREPALPMSNGHAHDD
jgi:hypothetical protein